MQRCNDLLIAGIKTYGGLTSYLGNPDGGRSLLSELQRANDRTQRRGHGLWIKLENDIPRPLD